MGSFSRAAQALETIRANIFGVPCTHHFDDFSVIVPAAMGEIVDDVLRETFVALGLGDQGGEGEPTGNGVQRAKSHLRLASRFGSQKYASHQKRTEQDQGSG